ncbi:hypothetical protein BDR07DRAFT_1424593 [Suillus spraguei]|nr:hypothetical protein BDR07DRAFT_1424593 [Suillus spraguei]
MRFCLVLPVVAALTASISAADATTGYCPLFCFTNDECRTCKRLVMCPPSCPRVMGCSIIGSGILRTCSGRGEAYGDHVVAILCVLSWRGRWWLRSQGPDG